MHWQSEGQTRLFIGKGEGKTASGLPMLPLPINRTGKLTWSMTLATRGDYQSVEANWHNEEAGHKEKVTEGEGSPIKKLRHAYATKEEAQRAAKAKLDEIKRGNNTLRMTMPGNPLVAAEGQIPALGFRIGVAGLWSITRARHQIRGSSFTTSIETEKPKSEVG